MTQLYAILDTTHPEYNGIIAYQKMLFEDLPGATNFVPILSLDGSKALIKVFTNLPVSDCVIASGGEEVPASRTMSEWENPISL